MKSKIYTIILDNTYLLLLLYNVEIVSIYYIFVFAE